MNSADLSVKVNPSQATTAAEGREALSQTNGLNLMQNHEQVTQSDNSDDDSGSGTLLGGTKDNSEQNWTIRAGLEPETGKDPKRGAR